MTYYKALDGLESCHGGHATWEPGRWMPWVRELIPCKQGYHVCDGEEQMLWWITSDIWTVEVKGVGDDTGGKVVAHQARIVEKTAWDDNSAVRFAKDCIDRINDIDSPYAARARSSAELAARFSATVYSVKCSASAYARAAARDAACAADYASADYAAAYATERQWQAERFGRYLRGEL